MIVLLAAACRPPSSEVGTDEIKIDSLLSHQVKLLAEKRVGLVKTAAAAAFPADTILAPAPIHWREELEVFRDLGLVNSTIYKGTYRIEDPVDDPRSNLKIRRFSNESAPLRSLEVYYQEDPARIRQLTGTIKQANPLYSTQRELMLHFDDVNGQLSLTGFSVSGFQKVALRDTVWFVVQGTVDW